MSVSSTYAFTLKTDETLSTNVADVASPKISHGAFDVSGKIDASTTVPATQCAYFTKALSTGTATIDLTSLTGTNGATVNLTGLKVQLIRFEATDTNANPITISEGASNGISLFGSSFTFTLQPGQVAQFYGNDSTPDVASGDRTIDLAGTGSQTLKVSIVAG